MKKSSVVLIVVLILIIVVAAVFVIPWLKERKEDPYATMVKPRIEKMTMLIKQMSLEETTMEMKILVDNPAPIGFTLDSLSYKVFIADTEIMESSYPKSVKLKGADSSWITLPVTVNTEKLIETLKSLENKNIDSVEYTIKSKVYNDIPFKEGPLELEFSKWGPAFVIPKVKVKEVKLKKFGLNESKAVFTAEIDNPNPIPFQFKQTAYKVKIDEDKLMEGKIDTAIIIPERTKTNIDMPVEVSLKETGETIFKMITKPGDVDYSFDMETTLIAETNMIKDSKMTLKDEGKLKELMKNK